MTAGVGVCSMDAAGYVQSPHKDTLPAMVTVLFPAIVSLSHNFLLNKGYGFYINL